MESPGSRSRPVYYELHVTLEAAKQDWPRLKADVENLGWKFSAIDGDPILGPGVKCYATKHLHQSPEVWPESIVRRAALALKQWGWTVTREKVELVLYDRSLKD